MAASAARHESQGDVTWPHFDDHTSRFDRMGKRKRFQRPKHLVIGAWPAGFLGPEEVAALVTYVGSAEHKDVPSFAGHPALRSTASRCPPQYRDPAPITEALREAIRRGCVGTQFEGQFPKYVWGWFDGRLYEPRHISGVGGQYKAYPVGDGPHPKDFEGRLNWS